MAGGRGIIGADGKLLIRSDGTVDVCEDCCEGEAYQLERLWALSCGLVGENYWVRRPFAEPGDRIVVDGKAYRVTKNRNEIPDETAIFIIEGRDDRIGPQNDILVSKPSLDRITCCNDLYHQADPDDPFDADIWALKDTEMLEWADDEDCRFNLMTFSKCGSGGINPWKKFEEWWYDPFLYDQGLGCDRSWEAMSLAVRSTDWARLAVTRDGYTHDIVEIDLGLGGQGYHPSLFRTESHGKLDDTFANNIANTCEDHCITEFPVPVSGCYASANGDGTISFSYEYKLPSLNSIRWNHFTLDPGLQLATAGQHENTWRDQVGGYPTKQNPPNIADAEQGWRSSVDGRMGVAAGHDCFLYDMTVNGHDIEVLSAIEVAVCAGDTVYIKRNDEYTERANSVPHYEWKATPATPPVATVVGSAYSGSAELAVLAESASIHFYAPTGTSLGSFSTTTTSPADITSGNDAYYVAGERISQVVNDGVNSVASGWTKQLHPTFSDQQVTGIHYYAGVSAPFLFVAANRRCGDTLFVLDAQTGDVLASGNPYPSLPDPPTTGLTCVQGQLYRWLLDGEDNPTECWYDIYVGGTSSGGSTKLWRYDLHVTNVQTAPTYSLDRVWSWSHGGGMWAKVKSLTLDPEYTIDGGLEGDPELPGPGKVYFVTGDGASSSGRGNMYALRRFDARVQWKNDPRATIQ
jgi:hypothetical protein